MSELRHGQEQGDIHSKAKGDYIVVNESVALFVVLERNRMAHRPARLAKQHSRTHPAQQHGGQNFMNYYRTVRTELSTLSII